MAAAKLDDKPLQKAGVDRQSLKDDFKIIGHAKARDFGYLITADA